MSEIQIKIEDPHAPEATALLQASHALMQKLFNPEDNHFLSIDELCTPDIRFFVARDGAQALGCAAIANRGSYGEIKSMFVDPATRGRGVGDTLMRHLIADGREQGLQELKLETGDVSFLKSGCTC